MSATTIETAITRYRSNDWHPDDPNDLPGSTSEQMTIALAIDRPDLMPHGADTLSAYKNRLNQPQRTIVNQYRGWK